MKIRTEIEDKYKWDLSKIYVSLEEWDKDYQEVLTLIPKFAKYEISLMDNANNLYSLLSLDEIVSRKLDKMYVFASMHVDEDTSNTKYQSLLGRIKELVTKYSESVSYVSPLLLTYDYDLVLKYMETEPKLKNYEKGLEEIYRMKPHTLSASEEKILSNLGNIFANPEETYSYLTDSDMKFGNIIDENGKEVELTESNYSIYRGSKDRRVRKDSFDRIFETYGDYKNTISAMYSGNAEWLTKLARLRHFKSAREASLFDEEIDTKVYDNLVDTVNKNLDVLYDYFDIKKKVLGLDELHLYDTYASLVESYDKKYTFDEARDLVLKAMSVLGDDYVKNLNKAFDEHWIDIYPNKAKRGGAYSGGCYDTAPYVLLNFEGQYEDVSTLAHELGHSMHSYLTRNSNNYDTGEYKIFVAEVASTVNELLLAKYIINNTDDLSLKLFVLNNMLDLYKATIYRQVMFAEFERDTYKLHEEGVTLTNEELCDLYYKLNLKYFGKDVKVDELIKNEWMRIPHFYYNFYVYKYAIGLSSATNIVNNILSGKKDAIKNYIKFLSSGSVKPPMELLKDTGCDLHSSAVTESAIKMFSDLLDEFIRTYNEVEEGKNNGQERLLRGTRSK